MAKRISSFGTKTDIICYHMCFTHRAADRRIMISSSAIVQTYVSLLAVAFLLAKHLKTAHLDIFRIFARHTIEI